MPTLQPDALITAISEIFCALRVPTDAARVVAEHLVDADLCGVSSHGIIRVPQYVEAVETGRVVPDARLTIEHETTSAIKLDGGNGFGQVMAHGAMEIAIERASRTGAAVVTLHNCGHTGRIGAYTEQAARQGMAALMMVNSGGCGQWVAPFGGAAGRLATNPLSLAVPTASGDPLLLDIATSVAPEGKIRTKLQAGQPISLGWAVNHRGEPTTNPADLYGPPRGALLPFGGHKGFGLSMLVDALAGGLSGAGCCTQADRPLAGQTDGVLMLAINVSAFCPAAEFLNMIQSQIAHVKSAPQCTGTAEILVPGELESRTRRQRLRDGIPVEESTWTQFQQSASRFNVALPAC